MPVAEADCPLRRALVDESRGREPLAEQLVARPPQLVGDVRELRQGMGPGDGGELSEPTFRCTVRPLVAIPILCLTINKVVG